MTCEGCGIAAADLPYEVMGLTLEEAEELFFEHIDGEPYCQGCAHNPGRPS